MFFSKNPMYDLWYLCFSYVVFMFLLPFIMLIVMNVRIFRSLQASQSLRSALCRGGQLYSTTTMNNNDNNNHLPLALTLNATVDR